MLITQSLLDQLTAQAKGQWHFLKCLESGTVFMEGKDGAWEALGEDEILQL